MADVEGDDAENLAYSSHMYEQLRAAVYAVNEEAIRVGAHEWADLKRRLNERVGTLRVAITKLEPDWVSPGGREAIGRLRGQLEWMSEFARSAAWNEQRLSDVQDAYYEAIKAMRDLDAKPDRPNPGPAPAPDSSGYVDPAALNWKQPAAARIASHLYRRMAIAAATMSTPPEGASENRGYGDPDGTPGDVPVAPGYGSGSQGGQGAAGGSAAVPHASKSGAGNPGLVLGGSPPTTRASAPGGVRAPVAGPHTGTGRALGSGSGNTFPGGSSRTSGTIGGGSPGGVSGIGGGGASSAAAAPHGRSGATPGATGRVGGGPGSSTPLLDPGGRTLGGGLRPPPATPAGPGGAGGIPPVNGMPPGIGGAGQGGRRGKKRPGYEKGEPDTFVDGRAANTVGGQIRTPREEKSFDPLPGMLGPQKQKAIEEQRSPWELATEPTPSPEGFPDELKDFRQKDGTQFQVRRRSRGT